MYFYVMKDSVCLITKQKHNRNRNNRNKKQFGKVGDSGSRRTMSEKHLLVRFFSLASFINEIAIILTVHEMHTISVSNIVLLFEVMLTSLKIKPSTP